MTKKIARVSTSFSGEQVILLNEILSTMLRGGDPKLLIRNRAFASLAQTAQSMRRRAENPTAKRAPSTPPPDATPPEVPPVAPEDSSTAVAE